ncbi:hypothetical protein ACSS7Z_09955 [Microbacterium sp. A82]|uniref:RCC1 domain-containing protein n=1 Tax=Microbacterium sp. A82 TaxID=3450452 RepID=UPI003F3454EE
MLRNALRGLLAVSVAVGLVGVGVAANAAPDPANAASTPTSAVLTPTNGPTTGGTEVTITPPPGVTFTQVSAGSYHSVAVDADGTAYAWGLNNYGQLGDGRPWSRGAPVQVQMPAGVKFTQVSAGGSHSVALAEDGTAYAWGYNRYGQLGDGKNTHSNVPVRVQIPDGVTVTQVSAGNYHSVAVDADGTTYAWGHNGDGQLGDDTSADSNVPVQVQMPAGVKFTQVSAGGSHSVALAEDGTAYAWGYNRYGQLGDDTIDDSNVPVRVQIPDGVTVTQVSAGGSHSVAVDSDGTAYAWGSNGNGRLGDDTIDDSNVPVRVQIPDGVTVTQVSAGGSHSVAVDSDGTAYAWGSNSDGRLGDDKTTDSNVQVQVQMPAEVTVTQVSAGTYHSVALTEDGTAYAWGHNNYGQLGDGTDMDSDTPVPVLTDTTVTGVSFGGDSATNLVNNGDGSWTATTPPHAAGPVDVVVSWELNGVAQPDITYADAFTYIIVPDVAPTVSDPEDQVVTAGDAAMFTVEATGTPVPSLLWEFSTDDGVIWGPVGAADGTVSGDGKTLTVAATEALSGTLYRVTVENSVDAVTSEAATLTVSAAPVAPTVTDPADQWVTAGDPATFTVETTGTPEPGVTWEFSTDDGVTWTVVGAADGTVSGDGKTLTVAATEALSGFQYRATAENTVGAASSNAATLTVTAAPVAPTVTDPADQAVTAGDPATFTVETTGTPEPGVTWEFSTDDGVTWSAVGAADGTVSGDGKTLTVAATEALSGTLYRVTAENSVDAVTSEAATLTVAAVPVAPTVTDPEDQAVTAGDAAMFTVETTGTPVPSLLWEYSTDDGATWGPVGAADGTVSGDGKTLTVAATEALSGVLYRVTAENSVDAVTSEAATLTVTAVPVAPTVTDPEDQVVTAGDAAMFTVEATGTPEPSLLWEFSTDDGVTWGPVGTADGTVSGDGKTLTVAATEALSGTQYRVTAENSVDAVTSAPATLTVSAAPVIPPVTDPVAPPVTDSVGETDLARTGSDPVPAIAVAVLFALIGAGLLLASRRKHA